jgi:hypothetical protein
MAQIFANTIGIWHSFGYNFDDPNGNVIELSPPAQAHMDSMPPFISEWQAQDIANNDFGGYYQNNMQSITMLIYENANNIYLSTNNVTNMANVHANAATLQATCQNFLYHTAKLSGIVEYDGSDSLSPYMQQALSMGRAAMYIVNQTDGITNSAPILGSFTSLMIEPQLISNNNTLITYTSQVANSISGSTSNLTSEQMTTINNHMKNLYTFMEYRKNSDRDFYVNVKTFVEGYNKTKKLNNLGETEKYLLMNFIGTEKTKSRIT